MFVSSRRIETYMLTLEGKGHTVTQVGHIANVSMRVVWVRCVVRAMRLDASSESNVIGKNGW